MEGHLNRVRASLRRLLRQFPSSTSRSSERRSFGLSIHASRNTPRYGASVKRVETSHVRAFGGCLPSFSAAVQSGQRPSKVNPGEQFHEKDADAFVREEKDKQVRTPWHREGPHAPPAEKKSAPGAMSMGKLLTTPSRLLKLVLPVAVMQEHSEKKDVEPLALLVHPHQPLSYLERLIQAELPLVRNAKGEEKPPSIFFRAKDPGDQSSGSPKPGLSDRTGSSPGDGAALEAAEIDGNLTKTGKLDDNAARHLRGGPGEGGVESYSGLGREDESKGRGEDFIRWSASTEIGDFIREAARSTRFAIEIEGSPEHILVGVPSFNDRTHYMRMRLRKLSGKIADMTAVKEECDRLAHRGARRVAMGGFGLLAGWWGMVYWLTFKTSSGWDFVEPVTYLVGLTTVMSGYLWFLYHNREVSYRAALNVTISRRQNKLYQTRGFDLGAWERLIDEANLLRKEIKGIANEYDVDWNEKEDEEDDKVAQILEQERMKRRRAGKSDISDGKEDADH